MTISRSFVLSGNSAFSIFVPEGGDQGKRVVGEHVFVVERPDERSSFRPFFLNHTHNGQRRYVGIVNQNLSVRLTTKSAYREDHFVLRLIRRVLALVNEGRGSEVTFPIVALGSENDLAAGTIGEANRAMTCIADMFVFATGMGLKRRMIRVHHKGEDETGLGGIYRRFKIDLTDRGNLRVRTGFVHPETQDPVGDEEFMGFFYQDAFRPGRTFLGRDQYGNPIWGEERKLDACEESFLKHLLAKPAAFLAAASKDMNRCCYCGNPLSDPNSLQAGYGEVCAKKWGLPWGAKYDQNVPSFAEHYAREHDNPLPGIMDEIRANPYDDTYWGILRDWLTENNFSQRPEVPSSGVLLPNIS